MSEPVAVIRPAMLTDLQDFNTFANESGPGITTLPRNRTYLEEFLAHSVHSFTAPPSERGSYLFCLEYDKKVIGTSGIVSRKGAEEPFFAYRKRVKTFTSHSLGLKHSIPELHFIKARKKPTEIGTLYLQKQFRKKGLSPLLSLSRFLFIALFKERFASTVIAELRGVNSDGISPFWESVGRHFFGIDFSKADLLRTTQPEVIRELFPRHPLYTVLLPQEAQKVIGHPHIHTAGAKAILEKQGFRMSPYLDIFDAGPHLYAPTKEIHAVKKSTLATISELRTELEGEKKALIATCRVADFRACLSSIRVDEHGITLPVAVGKALNVDPYEQIIYYELT